MNGYSRIKQVSSTERSNSIDFSDLSLEPKSPNNPIKTPQIPINHNNKENQKQNTECDNSQIEPIHEINPENQNQEDEEEETVGEIFGVILSRNCSISSKPSNNFMFEKQSSSSFVVQSAMKRTLSSIKRSASVSDGYCRIHHQYDNFIADGDDEEDVLMVNRMQRRSVMKAGKIFSACKRIFGF